MRTKLTLQPGQRGTKRLLRMYGDRLVCVRYRYDIQRKRRVKTVELIVDEQPWERGSREPVGVRIHRNEPVLRNRLKAAGGTWNPTRKLWEAPYGAVRALQLEDRLVW